MHFFPARGITVSARASFYQSSITQGISQDRAETRISSAREQYIQSFISATKSKDWDSLAGFLPYSQEPTRNMMIQNEVLKRKAQSTTGKPGSRTNREECQRDPHAICRQNFRERGGEKNSLTGGGEDRAAPILVKRARRGPPTMRLIRSSAANVAANKIWFASL